MSQEMMSVPPRNRRQQAKMIGVVVFDDTKFPKSRTIRELREENRVVRDRGEYCHFSDPLPDDESE